MKKKKEQALRVISMFTQKGGVGKTTGSYNVATTLALGGAKVLLIDADPQANLTRNAIKFILSGNLDGLAIDLNEAQREIIINMVQENLLLVGINQPIKSASTIIYEAIRNSDLNDDETFNGDTITIEGIEQKYHKIIEAINKIQQSTNLLKTLDWINKDWGIDNIKKRAQETAKNLLSIPFEQNQETNENLLILPGHQHLYLEYSRPIALAIEGLTNPGGALSSFSSRIFKMNELIRAIGENSDIDIVVIDLSPAAIEFNEAMVMISDYLLMTLSPEPNSDHAMLSMLPILKRWKKDFDNIYGHDSESGFRTIESPPEDLGVFFQKVNKQLNNVKSTISRFIIGRIEHFHDTELAAYLTKEDMTTGLKSNTLPKVPHFTSTSKSFQFSGAPIVLNDASHRYNFKKIISLVFENQSEYLRPRVNEAVAEFSKIQEANFDKLSELWTNDYIDKLKNISFEDRIKKLKRFSHHYDYYDFSILLLWIIEQKFPGAAKIENTNRVYTAFPIVLDDSVKSANYFTEPLQTVIEPARKWTNLPKYIIIPFMNNLHWSCVRVQVDEKSNTLDVLFDDPFGGELVNDTNSNKAGRHIWDGKLRSDLFSALCIVLSKLYGRNFKGMTPRCKNINQQHKHRNYEGLSGLITLTNIASYLEAKENIKYPAISTYHMLDDFARKNNLKIEITSKEQGAQDVYELNISEKNMGEIVKAYATFINSIIRNKTAQFDAHYKKFFEKLKSTELSLNMQHLTEKMLAGYIYKNLDCILEDEREQTTKVFLDNFDADPECIVNFIAHAQKNYIHNKKPNDPFHKKAITIARQRISKNPQPSESKTKKANPLAFLNTSLVNMFRLALNLRDIRFTGVESRKDYHQLAPYDVNFAPGNCLFEAVAAYTTNTQQNATTLRQITVQHIAANIELRNHIATLAGNQENQIRTINGDRIYQTIDEYLQHMGADQTWGTAIEIIALANALQRPIVVFTPTFEEIFAQDEYRENEPIFINYINNNHYQPLSKPPHVNGRDILTTIEQKKQNESQNDNIVHMNKKQKINHPEKSSNLATTALVINSNAISSITSPTVRKFNNAIANIKKKL
ncbi:MAG: AAA family ATPase [Legionellales bacterium]|jgi:cellulose biosynthesis protein BcsQ